MDTPARAMRDALAVLVPCYNAGARLAPVVAGLQRHVGTIILVDDGSTDAATSAHAAETILVRFPENRGKGHALLAGFERALAEPAVTAVAVVDADGQHDPDELPRLYAAFRESGAGLVIGTREFDAAHVPWRSRIGNKTTRALTRILLGQPIADTQSGYRIHSRALTETIVAQVAGGRYETEMDILVTAVRSGFDVVSVPIRTIYEAGNPSSHFDKYRDSARIYRRLFRAALRRRRVPNPPTR